MYIPPCCDIYNIPSWAPCNGTGTYPFIKLGLRWGGIRESSRMVAAVAAAGAAETKAFLIKY